MDNREDENFWNQHDNEAKNKEYLNGRNFRRNLI